MPADVIILLTSTQQISVYYNIGERVVIKNWLTHMMQDFSVTARSRYYPRLMIAAVNGGTANQTASFMKRGDCLGAHIATNGALMNVKRGCDARCINDRIADWTKTAANDETLWSNWQV